MESRRILQKGVSFFGLVCPAWVGKLLEDFPSEDSQPVLGSGLRAGLGKGQHTWILLQALAEPRKWGVMCAESRPWDGC